MDNVSKMRASLKGGLKPKDTLIPAREVASISPAATYQQEVAYTELTTLPLSKEQKALIEDLGIKLQRQKTGKKKPELNWKSIMRGMIGLLHENTFDGVSVSSEEELHQLIKDRFGR